jgi:5'-nucleotidase
MLFRLRTTVCALAVAVAGTAGAAAPAPFTVKIIGFNDYHGTLQSPGTFGQNTAVPAAQRPAVGGADYIAGHVAKLKSQNPLNVVVGAGDFIGASPLISALFSDEPAVETLNRIGVDFNAVGNHEFDKGKTELKRLQSGGCKTLPGGGIDPTSCKGATVGTPFPFEGAKYKWLSANVFDTATGQTLLPAYGVKTFNGVRVAFIGMTLKGTPTIVTPTGVAGLEFRDEAATVNALVPRLRAQGIEAIVVLVHQGGFEGRNADGNNLGDINSCVNDLKNTDGSPSDIARIVAQLDNAVDLVVSGHTHAAYNCSATTVDVTGTPAVGTTPGVALAKPRNAGLPNASGRLVPVTSASAFGRILTDIDVTINPATRDIVDVRPTNRLVSRVDPTVTPNAAVASIVANYNALVSPVANKVLGSITEALAQTTDINGRMPAGELIADSQFEATRAPDFGGAVIAFMNAGGVRSPGFTFPSSAAGEGDGNVTYGEAFTVQPFGNSLVTTTVTAQNLKDVLEQQFTGCNGQVAQRIMIPSAGFKYDWSASGTCGTRIRNVRLVDVDSGLVIDQIVDAAGVVQNPTKPYRITINNFLATGGDGFTTFLQGTDLLGGAQDIDALSAYLAKFNATGPTPAAPYNPNAATLQKPRVTRVP